MAIKVQIVGRNGRIVDVNSNGQLIVGPIDYSEGEFNDMNVVNTAFNFHKPIAGKRFVITGLLAVTSRDVGPNGAVIEFYEASAVDSTTVDKTIFRLDMLKGKEIPLFGLNNILTEGVFLNGKTDDTDVLATISGYEVDS